MSKVLGISITDLEIASVVADAGTGEVLGRNFVELTGPGPDLAFDAVYQLVESAPIVPDSITVACSDSGIQLAIADIIATGVVPSFLLSPFATDAGAAPEPSWFPRTTVVGTPLAFAEVAATQFGSRGVVTVADLDSSGALFPGQSVALVDTDTRTVVGASAIASLGDRFPVTEPDGAQTLADAMGIIPNPAAQVFGVLVVGPGAQLPGVAPSLEYALQLPVQITEDAQYATAYGAAMVAAAVGASRDNTRWVLLSAAAGAALLLAVGVIVAVVMTGGPSQPETAVNEKPASIVSASSSSSTTASTSKGKSRISSPTAMPETTRSTTTVAPPPPPPPTRQTITLAPPPITVTQTPPPVTTTTPPASETTTTTTKTTTTTTTTTTTSPSGSEGRT